MTESISGRIDHSKLVFQGFYPIKTGQELTASGTALFESPDPRLIAQLSQQDPRISYFPFRVSPALRRRLPFSDEDIDKLFPEKEKLFDHLVFNPLRKKMKVDVSSNLPVGIRGTACSINGDIETEDVHVRDIQEILLLGHELAADDVNVTRLDQHSSILNAMSRTWTLDTYAYLQFLLGEYPRLADRVFPVVFVYDRTRLTPKGTNALLPDSPVERARVILRAYILDKPISKVD